ncbi:MAG: phospholipase D family protein, partial [Planctomycetota bacterium]
MLEPAGRVLYLEQLRPPDGYRLDCAVATTYSLDLVSLLMAPMSMALMEVDEPQETLEDPVALLEALRRTTGRFSIFCQQGRISIPRTESLLYGYLESSVVEVQPPHEHAVFHPKIWLLRFTDEDENILYRFLCLSRNLTNDRSWDTAVVLDGELAGQGETFLRNRPLSEFVSALPGLSVQEPANNTVETCDLISDEIRRVDFEVPDPFRDEGEPEDLMFAPMGLPEVTGPSPRHEGSNRHLVVSPFLSAGKIREIAEHGSDNVLISRSDELEGLNQSTCKDIEGMDTDLYVLGEGADHPDEVTGQRGGRSDVEEESDEVKDVSRRLSGLHAKLYLIEHGAYDVRLWSGSANATNAGLGGRNVELLVGLRGWRREMGIDKVLGEESDQEKKEVTCLRDLLRRYAPSEQEKTEDEVTRKLERELQNARRKLACADLQILASRSDESYELTLRATEPLSLEEDQVSGMCFLVTQGEDAARNLSQLLSGDCVRFENVS